MTEEKSNCCSENICIHYAYEGTGCYVCSKCGNACDPIPKVELTEEFRDFGPRPLFPDKSEPRLNIKDYVYFLANGKVNRARIVSKTITEFSTTCKLRAHCSREEHVIQEKYLYQDKEALMEHVKQELEKLP